MSYKDPTITLSTTVTETVGIEFKLEERDGALKLRARRTDRTYCESDYWYYVLTIKPNGHVGKSYLNQSLPPELGLETDHEGCLLFRRD